MRFAAAATATGIVGFLLLEALKILVAPAALWLLGVVMMLVKVLAVGLVVVLALAGSVWGYRRWSQARDEIST
jgi:heme/copper-type cytochrome/quinol oxidase subunit 2